QYSFCVALFEALEGRSPFDGATERDLRDAKECGDLRWKLTPAWVRRIIERGLSPEPGARYPSMRELLDDLANDPRRRVVRALAVVAVLVLVARAVWLVRVNEARHADRAAAMQRQADLEHERALQEASDAEAARRETIDRADRLTLGEVEDALERDPTLALATLKKLSDQAPAWRGPAR